MNDVVLKGGMKLRRHQGPEPFSTTRFCCIILCTFGRRLKHTYDCERHACHVKLMHWRWVMSIIFTGRVCGAIIICNASFIGEDETYATLVLFNNLKLINLAQRTL